MSSKYCCTSGASEGNEAEDDDAGNWPAREEEPGSRTWVTTACSSGDVGGRWHVDPDGCSGDRIVGLAETIPWLHGILLRGLDASNHEEVLLLREGTDVGPTAAGHRGDDLEQNVRT
jgi:hypothetical protein